MSKAPLSTSQARAAWYPPCHPVAPFAFWNGTRVSGDARVHPALAAMNTIMARHGYGPRQADTGMQVCRQITGGTGYSLHAYGIAIDVNWQSNPYFSYPASRAGHCDMPEAMVAEITALRTVNDAPVWGWGGNYRSIRDFMHYEIVCTPADLATGIAGVGPGPLTDTEKLYWLLWADDQAKDKPVLGRGMVRHPHRNAVRQLQAGLGIARTGVYGPRTRSAVRQLQAFVRIPVTGVVDRETWKWVIYGLFTKGRR